MQKQRLGRTELDITRVGVGAWAIGGGGTWGWGEQDDADSVAAIHRAIERGANWIDTAPAYGLGRSEEVVGRAVKGLADPPFIFSKCGSYPVEGGTEGRLKAKWVRQLCEDSLRRLQVEAIDLYQIHWPDPDEDVEEGWATLAELKAEGKLRHIGVSNFSVAQLERAEAIAPVESLQPPYSLIARDVEASILPWCAAHDTGVIVYSPMASGLLSGRMTKERVAQLPADDFRSHVGSFEEPALSRNLALADRLAEIGARHGTSAGAVAVAWTLRNPAVDGAIVGFRRPDQVDPILTAAALELTDADIGEIGGDA
jgi:aryl-alcohol dehydrogenase-like predicted oxidoreductase